MISILEIRHGSTEGIVRALSHSAARIPLAIGDSIFRHFAGERLTKENLTRRQHETPLLTAESAERAMEKGFARDDPTLNRYGARALVRALLRAEASDDVPESVTRDIALIAHHVPANVLEAAELGPKVEDKALAVMLSVK